MSTMRLSQLVVVIAGVGAGGGAGCGCRAADPPATVAPTRGGPHGIETANLDRRVDPCTDFFGFSLGGWQATNPIPDGLPRWSQRAAAREATKATVLALLDEVAANPRWPRGSTEQLVGDFYASCMDETSVDAAGAAPIAPLLAELDAVETPADVQRMLRRLHALGIAAAFGATGGLDTHEPTQLIARVVAGHLGMPDRDYYVDAAPRFAEARDRYRAHVARVFGLAGRSAAQATAAAVVVLELETRLAAASLGRAATADPAKTYHPMTLAELQALTPHLDWARYVDAAALPPGELDVPEPALLAQVDHELAQTPVAAWRTWLAWQLLDAASPYLARPFADEAFDFTDHYLAGAAEPKPRAQRCAELTEALLGDALGKKYVEAHFPPEAKAKVEAIIASLVAVLRDDVAELAWMTPATRRKALDKLATYTAHVGYPEHWKDYAGLAIERDALWANVAAARRFAVAGDRARIGKPTDPLWELSSAASAGPYIDLQLNEIVLPAGYLQPPVFDLAANDAVNYGAIGVSVAHDLTHSIDLLGADLDPRGRPRPWWTDADRAEFARRGQCVADQFDGYFIEPGVHHQGAMVLGESVGDLAGLRLAYLALTKQLAAHPVPAVDGFTAEQQFFISSAQSRGETVRIEAQREIVKTDPHPVSKFRVNGPLSNLPEFHRAFGCQAGAAMVRPPAQRCAVW